jgi:hypothetical protein
MALPNRSGRPATRLGQPAVKAPAKASPASRPTTGPIAKPAAPPARGRAPGPPTRNASRPVPKQAQKSNTPMIIGIVAGVVVILGIAAFAMSGNSSEKSAVIAPKEASKKKPMDVGGLENEGLSKCEQGLDIMKKNEVLIGKHPLSDGEKVQLRGELEKARKLLVEGMGMLTQANEKSGHQYDAKQFQEAQMTARKKLMELRD